MMKIYRVTYKSSDGLQYMSLAADSPEDARRLAEKAQLRREERFPLTFARLEEAAATGKPGQLAISPGLGGKALTEAWVKAETEKRKADHDRYVTGAWKIVKVEERN
jgi:hypothetical protein